MYMQNFMPTPIGGNYQTPTDMYAHGGHVGLHHHAENLRHYGQGRDKVLAHINPAEADYLANHHGMSINPHTGLPQFGLWDMVKSAGSALGGAAMQAAPGLWAEYGQPLAQSALQNIDTRIQNSLPGMAQNLGQKIGGQRFGQQLGQMGQSFGQNLANQFGSYGGFAGQVMPRMNQAFGVQGPAAFPQAGRGTPMNVARNVGTNMWNEVGQPMAQNALQKADQGISQRLGSVPGVGGALSEAYSQTPGMSGYAMPRMQQAAGRMQPQMGAYAHGGHINQNNPYMYGGGHLHQYPYM